MQVKPGKPIQITPALHQTMSPHSVPDTQQTSQTESLTPLLPVVLHDSIHITSQFTSSESSSESNLENGEDMEPNGERQFSFQVIQAKRDGTPRFCNKCLNFKPDRTHHCSSCGHCILRFDHHCPWINGCVGFANYSFFYLFVFYGLLYCLFVFCAGLPVLMKLFSGKPQSGFGLGLIQIAIMSILAGAFTFALLFFVGLHTHLLLTNQTTLESMEDGTRIAKVRTDGVRIAELVTANVYNIGWRKNVEASFGKVVWKWFFPLDRRDIGDGHSFAINADAYV
jgi:hypothetical protein